MSHRSVRRAVLLVNLILALSLACSAVVTAAPPKGKSGKPKKPPERILKKRIAVLPMDVSVAPGGFRYGPTSIVAGVTDMLTSALRQTGRFIVVERARLEGVLGEQRLADEGLITPEQGDAHGSGQVGALRGGRAGE